MATLLFPIRHLKDVTFSWEVYTASTFLLHRPRACTNAYQYSFCWKNLPSSLHSLNSLQSFKHNNVAVPDRNRILFLAHFERINKFDAHTSRKPHLTLPLSEGCGLRDYLTRYSTELPLRVGLIRTM